MKKLIVLFGVVLILLSGCSTIGNNPLISVSIDKEAGIARTRVLGQVISSGYTHRSGVTVINPSPYLLMDCYVVETGTRAVGSLGSDVFVPAYGTTNYQNSMTIIVRFYDRDGNFVDKDSSTFRAYFYGGSWNDTWRPHSRVWADRENRMARFDPDRPAT